MNSYYNETTIYNERNAERELKLIPRKIFIRQQDEYMAHDSLGGFIKSVTRANSINNNYINTKRVAKERQERRASLFEVRKMPLNISPKGAGKQTSRSPVNKTELSSPLKTATMYSKHAKSPSLIQMM